jgi:hypothetical protein
MSEHDPRRALVVEQVAETEVPRDPVVQHLALAWAVKDLVAWADGDEPSTWNATVVLGAAALPERRVWRRHLHCGCAWDLVRASG